MKIISWKIKNKKPIKAIFVNLVIVLMLGTVFAFSYAGGTLQAFTSTSGEAIYFGDKNSKNISLMINVYWGDEYLPDMLNVLKENNVKTTFFVGGVWACKNLSMLENILKDGHELGNHGYYHKDHDNISEQENYNEINQNHQIVKELTGVTMTLFAPPSGAYNSTTIMVAESLGYKTILWTRDTIDWRDQNKNLIYNRAIKNASGGDLILMHPTKETLNALPDIISHLKSQGFNLTTVTETLG